MRDERSFLFYLWDCSPLCPYPNRHGDCASFFATPFSTSEATTKIHSHQVPMAILLKVSKLLSPEAVFQICIFSACKFENIYSTCTVRIPIIRNSRIFNAQYAICILAMRNMHMHMACTRNLHVTCTRCSSASLPPQPSSASVPSSRRHYCRAPAAAKKPTIRCVCVISHLYSAACRDPNGSRMVVSVLLKQ